MKKINKKDSKKPRDFLKKAKSDISNINSIMFISPLDVVFVAILEFLLLRLGYGVWS